MTAIARTRFTSRAATALRTLTATHESAVALACSAWTRRLSRHQPGNGLVVRRRPRPAREEPPRGLRRLAAHRARTRFVDRRGRGDRLAGGAEPARQTAPHRHRRGPVWIWSLPAVPRPAPGVGRNARRLPRSDALVFLDGVRPRRRSDASASPDGDVRPTRGS